MTTWLGLLGHMVSGDSTGQEHSCPAAVGPTDPNKALGGCPNQEHLVPPSPQSGEYLQKKVQSLLQLLSTVRCFVTGCALGRGLVHTVSGLPFPATPAVFRALKRSRREQLGECQLPAASKLPLRTQSCFEERGQEWEVGVQVKLCIPS